MFSPTKVYGTVYEHMYACTQIFAACMSSNKEEWLP